MQLPSSIGLIGRDAAPTPSFGFKIVNRYDYPTSDVYATRMAHWQLYTQNTLKPQLEKRGCDDPRGSQKKERDE
jgi:hypothetical protein